MSVKIIVDSTSDFNKKYKDKVEVVPLTVRFGEEEFIDGVTITNKEFYEKLIECDELPTTSQATPVMFEEVFKKVTENGDEAVVITLSGKLSGTFQSAVIASQEYKDKIFVVDSKSVTIGAGILTDLAVEMADKGMKAEKIAETLETEREKVRVVALLDTLEYLKKGGRISATVAFAAGILSIKPVVAIEDGEVKVLGKARGSKQGNNLLVSEIEKSGGVDFSKPIMLGYTGLSDALLMKYISDSKSLWEGNTQELTISYIGSVIGTHVGPGAIAVAFYSK